ncbi:multidrug ABC transporter permease/ATP-binding protein [Paenibacillus sambharensis]|uniref:Multidrug ABC transporter permease/ATP-binding protein n=1 Tax=Paenibacillus sambharensis TaxID=1803190 RepID=A0A2W1LDG1_9BACL|nr:ABC transporter ATP-binding protein [Paenibacillus sambharensis]PZD96843.1 multidrug ABC transporter permease/ATP-binding protein [Paenibacillus sambharensis]
MFPVSWLPWFFKERKGRYIAGLLGLTANTVLQLIPPLLIGFVVDRIHEERLTTGELNAATIGLFAVAVLLYAVSFTWSSAIFGGELLAQKQLSERLFNHLSTMRMPFFEKYPLGRLVMLSTNNINTVSQALGFGLVTLYTSAVGLVMLILSMSTFVNWKLALMVLLPMPLVVVWIRLSGKLIGKRWEAVNAANGGLNSRLYELFYGLRVIRSFGREPAFMELIQEEHKQVAASNTRLAFLDSLMQPVISLLVGASYVICIAYGTYLLSVGEIAIGQLVTLTLYIGMLLWPVTATGNFINILEQGRTAWKQLHEAFQEQAEDRHGGEYAAADQLMPLEFRSLTFRYPGAGRNSLRHIDLRIEQGQVVGIVGKSGSGKSTLLMQLLRQYPLPSSSVYCAGVPIEAIDPALLTSWISYVPQRDMLLAGSIRENITLGKPEATDDEVRHITRLTMLEEDIKRMPDGWDTRIGEGGIMISGGQKQRIAIARALLTDPELLLMDDACSSLDAETESRLLSNIAHERKGKPMLIVTHKLSTIREADWIIVMDNGGITEQGSYKQLIEMEGWFRRQYLMQRRESARKEEEMRYELD